MPPFAYPHRSPPHTHTWMRTAFIPPPHHTHTHLIPRLDASCSLPRLPPPCCPLPQDDPVTRYFAGQRSPAYVSKEVRGYCRALPDAHHFVSCEHDQVRRDDDAGDVVRHHDMPMTMMGTFLGSRLGCILTPVRQHITMY